MEMGIEASVDGRTLLTYMCKYQSSREALWQIRGRKVDSALVQARNSMSTRSVSLNIDDDRNLTRD